MALLIFFTLHNEAAINWSKLSIIQIILIGCAYIILTYILHWFIESYVIYKNYKLVKNNYNKLRMKSDVFKLLNNAMRTIPSTRFKSRISFGDLNSDNVITIFSNPYCGPCAAMHNRLEDLIERDCRIDYVFGFFDEYKSQVNKLIISAYSAYGANKTWEILSEWYKQKTKDISFFDSYKDLDVSSEWVNTEFENHKRWISEAKLYSTPTIIYNNHLLSPSCEIDDFKYILNRRN